MISYPMNFLATSRATSDIQSSWVSSTADARSVECAIPKEFSGPNSGYSPEDLFISALMNCYVATLKVIAANSRMSFTSVEGTAKLTLDRESPNSPAWMTKAEMKFTARGVENVDRFKRFMERVSHQCMVVNSVKTMVVFEFEAVLA